MKTAHSAGWTDLVRLLSRGTTARRPRLDRRASCSPVASRVSEQLEDRTLLAAFTVNTFADTSDANPGDGAALDANGMTSLRAAVEEAAALAGADTILMPTPGVYSIGASLEITDDLTISGASANMVILDGGQSDRIFTIYSSTVSVSGLAITGGAADALGGGGLANFGGDVTLNEVRVSGNNANSGAGGGIVFAPDFTALNSPGSLTIVNSLIDSNSALRGGGISIEDGAGTAQLINSTVSLNVATTDGGGIFYYQDGTSLTIRNATITGNRVTPDNSPAQTGGGLYIESFPGAGDPLPVLHNTIVAGNSAGTTTPVANDIASAAAGTPLVNAGSSFNLIGNSDTAGGLLDGVNGNVVGIGGLGTRPIETILASLLTDNGGPTFTHALAENSIAIDAGSNAQALNPLQAPLTTDQRGTVARILDGDGDGTATVDMGAFEAPEDSGGGGGGSAAADIVGRNSNGSVALLVSDGTKFTDRSAGLVSPTVDWDEFVTGDFNGDGLADWAGRSPTDGQWRVLL
ncbi:MAG: hypothetical protein KF861_19110, partial [Planctomycetaceae bacterium]|nr:hypothetical protein [Planctomycetaceae bacterium]